MLKRKLINHQAQSVLEYAAMIICAVLALVLMQNYIRRGMQGKLRQSADELGQQYAPRNTTGNHTLRYFSNSTIKIESKSERELHDQFRFNYGFDLDGDGRREEYDVFGMTTNNTLINSTIRQEGNETVTGGSGYEE